MDDATCPRPPVHDKATGKEACSISRILAIGSYILSFLLVLVLPITQGWVALVAMLVTNGVNTVMARYMLFSHLWSSVQAI